MKGRYLDMEYSIELLESSKKIIDGLNALFTKKSDSTSATSSKLGRFEANKFFIDHSGEAEGVASIEEFCIYRIEDNFQIPVRHYKCNDEKRIIVFAHGGGWTRGNLQTHDYLCRKIVNMLKINVLAVDYRLAPEHIFPTSLNDIASVYSWCCEKYDKIYISGDSAGGNLCAALCIKISEEQLRKPEAMILFYPALGNDFNTKSYELFGDIIALSRASVINFLSQYSGEKYNSENFVNNKFIIPNLEENMNIFPRTFIVSAGCDVLLTEQINFVEKMRKAGQECEHVILDGAIHGFAMYGKEFDNYNTNILQQVYEWI